MTARIGSTGFSANRIDQHVGTKGRRVTEPIHRGTGLYQATEINGRTGSDDELAARERAYQRGRDEVADLIRVAPRPADKWAAVEDALKAVRRG